MHLFTRLTETIKSDISSSDKLEYSGSILLGATSLMDTHPILCSLYISLNPICPTQMWIPGLKHGQAERVLYLQRQTISLINVN